MATFMSVCLRIPNKNQDMYQDLQLILDMFDVDSGFPTSHAVPMTLTLTYHEDSNHPMAV